MPKDVDRLRNEIMLCLDKPRRIIDLCNWCVWPHRRKASDLDKILEALESEGRVKRCVVDGQAAVRKVR